MTDTEFRSLLRDIAQPGEFYEGSAHWRAQNQLAHSCLGMMVALIALDAGFTAIEALIIAVGVGAVWELTVLFRISRINAPNLSPILKSAADVVFYFTGALIVTVETLAARFTAILLLFVLLSTWAAIGGAEPISKGGKSKRGCIND